MLVLHHRNRVAERRSCRRVALRDLDHERRARSTPPGVEIARTYVVSHQTILQCCLPAWPSPPSTTGMAVRVRPCIVPGTLPHLALSR